MALRYVAYNWVGRRVKGVLDTNSEQDAYDRLEEEGLIPYQLKPVRPRRSLVQILPFLFRPARRELIEFTREMSSLISSGIPLHQALAAVREGPRSPGFKEALRRVIEQVEAGNRFSEACASVPALFPDFYVRVLRIAETTGALGISLNSLAEILERSRKVRNQVRSALTYPAITLAMAIVAGFVLITVALPSLLGFLEEFGDEDMPATTRALITARQYLLDYGTGSLIGVAGFVTAVFVFSRTPRGHQITDRLLLKLPVIGHTLVLSNTFAVTSTIATLLDSGVPPVDAIRLSRESVTNTVILRALTQIGDDVAEGDRLAVAFERQSVFPALLAQAVRTGEAGGTLRQNLMAISEFYENETERAVNAATELVQPITILIVAGIVGFVAIGIISGIYSSIGAVQ